ncbi:dihydrolipoamide acetyltransferase family protein [Arthrobacter sp. UM1]|uniref:dihydrolipoamide acetyltransferase family protein n=1 Tax=Arthrobacter sp. UM1 TaxID=2766776 RepID=UPI001CF65B0D|nr:dihydrolipoamide acetyltransferase family protein [Arthrobacter sp. UM1]MCB4208386.1 2-oxo acid dehydrogenase subunit E2 [Arthrobacter sp. UM1]
MSQVFMLPDLGEGLTEAEVSQWLVAVGDTVAVDQPVVEVETAKAAVEVPSPFAGTVATLHGEPGETLEVGSPLITIAKEGEAAPEASAPRDSAAPASSSASPSDRPEVATSPSAEAAAAPGPSDDNGGSGAVLIGYGTPGGAAASRRRRAPRSAAPVSGSGASAPENDGGGAASGERRAGADAPRVSSPLVRKLARDNGVAVASLTGSGPDGLVLRADVEKAMQSASAPAAASGPATTSGQGTADPRTGLGVAERTPVKGVRKAVAEAMTRSRREIPEATVWVDVDATRLMKLRASLKEQTGSAPGLLAFVSRFVLAGLERHPELAMRIEETDGGSEIVRFDGVNLGFAAQTDRGLVVPSLERADRMSAAELDAALRDMTAKAREGRCTPAELTRGTFTVNNYGVFGVDGSAAIINAPEAAILGLGRIVERPWAHKGKVRVRQVMELTLSFDHRVCDGGAAGGFLRFVADCIENPKALLAHL